jgi:predicted HD phosphohydrolase
MAENGGTQAVISATAELAESHWEYIEPVALDDFKARDWQILDAQRAPFQAEHQADQILRFLTGTKDDPTFGYRINNYQHCLQSATMAMQAGYDEETIVVALLHDVGFITCPDMHGEFAAALLGAYVSEKQSWMLVRHGLFQMIHVHERPGNEPDYREKWRGHPYFDWTVEFVDKLDQNAIDPNFENADIEHFRPMVQRIFAREPKIQGPE